jgi:hypothetical protein
MNVCDAGTGKTSAGLIPQHFWRLHAGGNVCSVVLQLLLLLCCQPITHWQALATPTTSVPPLKEDTELQADR